MKQTYNAAHLNIENREIVESLDRITCCTSLYDDGCDKQTIRSCSALRSIAV